MSKEKETKEEEKKCEHYYEIFEDPKLRDSGCISVYCKKCLDMKKVKKDYEVWY